MINNMTYYLENSSLCLNECLNYPLSTRCAELSRLIDCGSIKDLHDFFPVLVKSIFGYPGWGLRTITRETAPIEFEYVYSFFVPLGPMLRLCYRLLSEPIKFDVPIESLPQKTIQMLNNGRYSVFYSDILNIDPYRRQIASLQLNAFDYFILHFTLHGMSPLHKQFPAALTVHNDHLKTVYYFLTADYLCTFLPTDPNTEVQPSNVYCSIKSAAPVPMSPIVPIRRTKYLSRNVISHSFTSNATNIRAAEPSRSSYWRTESVLHLFIDTWLRYDVDGIADLPSSEFIQVVRVLVKQLHSFANSAEIDVTPMASLRSLSQPMMNAQINNFLRGIIQRWPLDSSFLVVLELWLSYIQPWRYTLNRQHGIDDAQQQIAIPQKFEKFIMENAASYTQIFIQLLPRFERLDFTSPKNVTILYRLARVFNQSNLAQLLRMHDRRLLSEHLTLSPNKSNLLTNISTTSNHSPSSPSSPQRPSLDVTDSFDSAANSTAYFSQRTDINYMHEDDTYICLFGSTERQRGIISKLEQFKNKLYESYECANQLINQLEVSVQRRYNGFFGYIKWYLTNDEETVHNQSLNDARKIAEVLEFVIRSFAMVFEEELPNFLADFAEFQQRSRDQIAPNSLFEDTSASDSLNLSHQTSPATMIRRIRKVQFTGDPLTLPARSNEIEFLVRFFYRLSCRLNETYAVEIEQLYRRQDLVGRIAQRVLESPRIVQTFEKSHGSSVLVERQLRPRVNLRGLATYRTIIIIALSFCVGKLLLGGSFFGLFLLIIFKIAITFLLATYEFVFKS